MIFLTLALAAAQSTQPAPSPCPTIEVSGNASGTAVLFTVNVSGGDPKATPTYN